MKLKEWFKQYRLQAFKQAVKTADNPQQLVVLFSNAKNIMLTLLLIL